MTTRIDFDSKSGERIQGELGEPAGSAAAPGLILIQEWWGVNDHIRSLVDRFSDAGFVTLAPDIYHGKTTKDAGEAGKLMQALDWNVALLDVEGAVNYLAKHPRCTGKVGITGFCMGGAVSLAAGARMPVLAAVVPFYGIGDPNTDYSKLTAPVLGHFGKKDDFIKPEAVQKLSERLESQGKKAVLHMYDTGHAFMNDTRPEAYDAPSAKLAWERTIAFLKENLA